MRDYDFDKEGWKDELCRAAARFLMNVTAMVPMIAVALAVGFFVHTLVSEPFAFSCKSTAAEHHRAEISRVLRRLPPTPTAEKTPVSEVIKTNDAEE